MANIDTTIVITYDSGNCDASAEHKNLDLRRKRANTYRIRWQRPVDRSVCVKFGRRWPFSNAYPANGEIDIPMPGPRHSAWHIVCGAETIARYQFFCEPCSDVPDDGTDAKIIISD
ncbi:MAG: hypothetical protein ACE5GX_13005 [Thermoanaerobaculia bacterium]